MAGHALRQKLADELDRRLHQEFDGEEGSTELDYVLDWQASGKTLNALAKEIGLLHGDGEGNGEFISRWLQRKFGSENVLAELSRARAAGAHRLVDNSLSLAREANAEDVNVKRLQVQTNHWVAERWNRNEYGQQRGPVVNVTIGELHLDALRRVSADRVPTAIAGAITVDAELLTDGEATTCDDGVADSEAAG